MKDNKLKFDIESISSFEYKLREISSMTSEELDNLEKEKQIAFLSLHEDEERFTQLMIMAPAAWFSSEDNFLDRICSDLFEYVTDVVERITKEIVIELGKLIDHMGLDSFMEYLHFDMVSSISNRQLGTRVSSIEDKGQEYRQLPDSIQYSLYKKVNTAAVGLEYLMQNGSLKATILDSEVFRGSMFIAQRYEMIDSKSVIDESINTKRAYFMCLDFDRVYSEAEEEDYAQDVIDIYDTYLRQENEES